MGRTYMELVEGTSSKFWEIVVEGTEHTVRYGRIGSDGRSSTKSFDTEEEARAQANKLIASKRKKGYAEPTAEGEAMSLEDLAEAYPELEERGDALFEMAEAGNLFRGNVTHDGPGILDIAVEKGDEGTVIVIDGDYTCTADSVEWGDIEEFSNNILFVTGDMHVHHMALVDIGMLIVKGNLYAKTFVGYMGDNGGSLDVDGDLVAEVVLGATYFMIAVGGEVKVDHQLGDGTYASDYADKKKMIWLGDANVFVDELTEDGEVEEWALFERRVAGEPIFVNDGKPREGAYDREW